MELELEGREEMMSEVHESVVTIEAVIGAIDLAKGFPISEERLRQLQFRMELRNKGEIPWSELGSEVAADLAYFLPSAD